MCMLCDDDAVKITTADGYEVCSDCAKYGGVDECYCCGSYVVNLEVDDNDNYYCLQCFEVEVVDCPDCGRRINRNRLEQRADGSFWCDECSYGYPNDHADVIACDEAEGGLTWAEHAECANLIGSLDFGCRFDGNGCNSCSWKTERACCAHCAKNYGYLRALPVESVETVKALYDEHLGFWSPNGCKLPREIRSVTCLSYYCHSTETADSPILPKVYAMLSGTAGAKETIEATVKAKAAFAV